MSESIKAVCWVLLGFALIGTVVSWMVQFPDGMTWGFRIASPLVGAMAIGVVFPMESWCVQTRILAVPLPTPWLWWRWPQVTSLIGNAPR